MGIAVVAIILGVGYLIATDYLQQEPGEHLTDKIWRVLYYPILFLQLILSILAISLGVNKISYERRNQTWDNLRATTNGAELALRTRWASIFYQVRGLLGLITIFRLVLIGGILYDLTAFRGGYLDMLTANITPEVPLPVGIVLLSLIMTGTILLPFTNMGLDAAIGLLISVRFRNNIWTNLFQFFFILIRIAIAVALLLAVTSYIEGDLDVANWTVWLLIFAFVVTGDWGIVLLQLSALGEFWADIPYSVFIGIALIVFAMLQSLLTDGILNYAVKTAEQNE
jgi:hypothetical protein